MAFPRWSVGTSANRARQVIDYPRARHSTRLLAKLAYYKNGMVDSCLILSAARSFHVPTQRVTAIKLVSTASVAELASAPIEIE